MLKIMTIIGTRPELIKMSRVIAEFDKYTNHVLVHTGQNFDYELNQIFFDDLNIRKPDYFLEAHSENAAKTIAKIIEKVDDILQQENPEALLLYGDTNSCLSIIAAKRRKIPVFHMEAGNRCFDERVPEEINRKIVDHLSDINLVLSEHARRYLLREGIPGDRIIKTGSHLPEVLNYCAKKIESSEILNILKIEPNKYFLVSAHREENVDKPSNLENLYLSLNTLAREYNWPIIVSTHPRTRKRLEELKLVEKNSNIQFLKPFGFSDYIQLQMSAFCILSDSGTITEEAALLNLPAITIRETHERPEGMDEATLIMSGLEPDRILNAVQVVTEQHNRQTRAFNLVKDYETLNVSKKILRIVLSYIDYVNSKVWFKDKDNKDK